MKKFKIGLLGTSNVASKNVIPTLIQLDHQFEIVGVSGRDYKKTLKYCSNFNLQAFTSHEDLLLESLDFVYISLPNGLHYEWVMKSISLGLNVVCEKSLGCNFSEISEMINLAKEKEIFLIEHFQFRFHNQLKKIKHLLSELGQIKSIRSSFCIPPFENSCNIRYIKELGGGALLDNGVYIFQLGQQFLGYNLSIGFCELKYNGNVDISGNLIIYEEENKVPIFGTFGFDHVYRCDLEILCSKGRIFTDRFFTAPKDHPVVIYRERQDGYNKICDVIELEKDDQILNLWQFVYENVDNKKIIEEEYKNSILQALLIDQALAYAKKK